MSNLLILYPLLFTGASVLLAVYLYRTFIRTIVDFYDFNFSEAKPSKEIVITTQRKKIIYKSGRLSDVKIKNFLDTDLFYDPLTSTFYRIEQTQLKFFFKKLTLMYITNVNNKEVYDILTSIKEKTDEVIFIIDKNKEIIYGNKAFDKLTGYNRSEYIGRNPNILNYKNSLEESYESLLNNLKYNLTTKRICTHMKKDGTFFYFNQTIYYVHNELTNNYYFISIGRDMTYEEKVSKNLSLERNNFKTLFNNSSNLLLKLNNSFNILEINDSALDKVNSKRESMVGQDFFDYLDKLKLTYDRENILSNITTLNIELSNSQNNTFNLSSTLLENSDLLIDIKDLSEIIRAEKFLESKNSILEFQIEKKTEELTLEKNKVLNFLNTIKIPIIELSSTFNILFVNNYAKEIFGIDSDYDYSHFIKFVIYDDLELLKLRYDEIGSENITFDSKYSVKDKEFSLLWTLTTITTDEKTQRLLVGDDITNIKELIKKQDELVSKFKNQTNDMKCLFEISELGNTSPSVNAIINDTVDYINNTWSKNVDLMVQIHLFNDTYPKELPEDNASFYTTDIKINKKVEGYLDVLSTTEKTFSKNQKDLFKSIILILENSIENKIYENRILEKQNKLIELQKIGRLGTWEYSFANDSLLLSEETKRILNFPLNEPKDDTSAIAYKMKSFTDYLSPEDIQKFSSLIDKLKTSQGEENLTIKYTLPNHKEINLFIQVKSIMDINNQYKLLGTMYEITDFIAIQRELEVAKVEAENSNKAKSLFLANMSHEIRTPLNAILGFAQVLLKNPGISNTAKDQISIINRSGEHLLTLINDILDISKVESGKVEVETNSFNIKVLLADIKNMFFHKANERNLEFSINYPKDLPTYLVGDSKKLKQVIVNLLGNSFKFTDEGSIHLTLSHEDLSDRKSLLTFKVEDTGTGISKNELDHVFDKFYQASNSRSGTGLGLSITKNLINIMGGDIEAESKLYEGTTFTFYIEFEIDSTKSNESTNKEISISSGNNLNTKILIVDDILENVTLLTTILKNIGIDVYSGTTASEGLYLFDRLDFDLIFMDIKLPDLDGKEVIKKMRMYKEKKQPIIIGISASTFEEDIESVLESGANDFIPKPMKLDSLYELLEKYLDIQIFETQNKQEKKETPEEVAYDFSPEFKENFLLAIEQGDFFQMSEFIEKLEDEQTKSKLKSYLDNFDYDKLREFFE